LKNSGSDIKIYEYLNSPTQQAYLRERLSRENLRSSLSESEFKLEAKELNGGNDDAYKFYNPFPLLANLYVGRINKNAPDLEYYFDDVGILRTLSDSMPPDPTFHIPFPNVSINSKGDVSSSFIQSILDEKFFGEM
jgi:hypothetical protein